jgi:hypothetical protein
MQSSPEKDVQFQNPSLRWMGVVLGMIAFKFFSAAGIFDKGGKYNQK